MNNDLNRISAERGALFLRAALGKPLAPESALALLGAPLAQLRALAAEVERRRLTPGAWRVGGVFVHTDGRLDVRFVIDPEVADGALVVKVWPDGAAETGEAVRRLALKGGQA